MPTFSAEVPSAQKNQKPASVAASPRLPGASKGGGGFSSESTDTVSKLIARLSGLGNEPENLERDLNLSSLDRVELMSALEQRYQVELNETAFAEAKTVGDVQHLLRQPSPLRTEYAYPRWAQREPVRWLSLATYYPLAGPAPQFLDHPQMMDPENRRKVHG